MYSFIPEKRLRKSIVLLDCGKMVFTAKLRPAKMVVSRPAKMKSAKKTMPSKAFSAAARTSVVAAFTVTLVTPDGESKIECDEDTYILDAAEVRYCFCLLRYGLRGENEPFVKSD